MKKLVLLLAAVMMSVVLMTPAAFAAPDPILSPTEVEVEETPPPLTETDPPEETEPPVETEPPEEVEIEDPEVPLADMPSPQTGVYGLNGMQSVSLMAGALALSGALVLAKARKQTGSVR